MRGRQKQHVKQQQVFFVDVNQSEANVTISEYLSAQASPYTTVHVIAKSKVSQAFINKHLLNYLQAVTGKNTTFTATTRPLSTPAKLHKTLQRLGTSIDRCYIFSQNDSVLEDAHHYFANTIQGTAKPALFNLTLSDPKSYIPKTTSHPLTIRCCNFCEGELQMLINSFDRLFSMNSKENLIALYPNIKPEKANHFRVAIKNLIEQLKPDSNTTSQYSHATWDTKQAAVHTITLLETIIEIGKAKQNNEKLSKDERLVQAFGHYSKNCGLPRYSKFKRNLLRIAVTGLIVLTTTATLSTIGLLTLGPMGAGIGATAGVAIGLGFATLANEGLNQLTFFNPKPNRHRNHIKLIKKKGKNTMVLTDDHPPKKKPKH